MKKNKPIKKKKSSKKNKVKKKKPIKPSSFEETGGWDTGVVGPVG